MNKRFQNNNLLCVSENAMKMLKEKLKSIRFIKYYLKGRNILNDQWYQVGQESTRLELLKKPSRTEIINYLLSNVNGETSYLEIGVRNPNDNYNHIIANKKYSVDPGIEFKENPVDYKMTSDKFFELLASNKILSSKIKFDLIFIDGLHRAEQVDRDMINSMKYIKDDGFVVLHDCNPPTEWHASENYDYRNSPAWGDWNGTTWKAFLKWRFNSSINSCCIDSDWGVGILSKKRLIGQSIKETNQFFEFSNLIKNRKEYLNLMDFNDFKELISKSRRDSHLFFSVGISPKTTTKKSTKINHIFTQNPS